MGILDGKAAVVTGAGRGIGKGHCLHLAACGASVVVNDVDAGEASAVVEEIGKGGGKAVVNSSDISTREGAQALVEQCIDEFGAIHGVVNNAGNVRDRTFLKMSDEEFEAVWRVHVGGTFMCSQEGALRMKAQGTGGAIVNTVSAAHFGNFGQTNYAGSKGAIASMTYTWALELARYGIRVNAISPSGTTRMSATYKGPDGKQVEAPFMDPNKNGPFVAYLLSDEGNWISGQIFGTGGNRVLVVEQPKYGRGVFRDEGWEIDDLIADFKRSMAPHLENFGLMKRPYPFLDGLLPPEGKK